MESCHSVIPTLSSIVTRVPHPPSYRRLPPKIYSTLQHLLQILEELHSKEELSEVLQSLAESGDDIDLVTSQKSPVVLDPNTIIRVSRILGKLNSSGNIKMATNKTGTDVASSAALKKDSGESQGVTRADLEVALKAIEGKKMSLPQQDNLYLVKKTKEFDQRVKLLKDKNRKFLEKNVELTALNRQLKDQINNINDENKKLKFQFQECQSKCEVLTNELETEKLEKGRLEEQVLEIGKLRAEISEQTRLVASLRQSCVEKERRMEVLQHRKKRRLRMSPTEISRIGSPSNIIDEDRSVDLELSTSSASCGTLSDDENIEEGPLTCNMSTPSITPGQEWQQRRDMALPCPGPLIFAGGFMYASRQTLKQLPNDDSEKNYKSLMKEHLALQKSMAKLQGLLGCRTDPQRYNKMKTDLETDLFVAHCKIESLESCLEQYKVDNFSWVTEKEELVAEKNCLQAEKQVLNNKVLELTKGSVELKEQVANLSGLYEDSKEQIENLEFMVLEAQHNVDNEKNDDTTTCDVSMVTDDPTWGETSHDEAFEDKQASLYQEIEELRCNETSLREQLEMSSQLQKQYRETIKGLESRLTQLLDGRASDVDSVVTQLKQAEQHVIDLEDSMNELQDKVVTLQKEKSGLAERLAAYKQKLDSQEHSLSLTRDEREELLQVKPKTPGIVLNPRLKLAEKGYENVFTKSQERTEPTRFKPERTSTPTKAYVLADCTEHQDEFSELSEVSEESPNFFSFDLTGDECSKHRTANSGRADKTFDMPAVHKKQRTKSEPAIDLRGKIVKPVKSNLEHEVDNLQKKIAELQEENDVLKFELTQNCRGDSFESASESEDPRNVELRETMENLQEHLHNAEVTERQYKDKLKLAERTINELEANELVLRDRVEEGNNDCDKLKKQIMRLQKKIKELKDIGTERENVEHTLLDKVKFLEDTEASLSQKVTELEGHNQVLQQQLDLKEELIADVHLVESFKEKLISLEMENNELNSKVIDLEEANEILGENWKKVADEEANRREQLEEKIRVLKCANNELKSKLKDKESDIELNTSGQSLATELSDKTIEQLQKRIKELEHEVQQTVDEKNEKIGSLQEELDTLRGTEMKLGETLLEMENSEKHLKSQISLLEKSENSQEAVCRMLSYEGKINKLKNSQENLLEKLDSMEDYEDDLKKRMLEMEENHEKKTKMLEKEIARFQQIESDLLEKIESYKDSESGLKKRIEDLEDSETNLTVGFSKHVSDLESKERIYIEEYKAKIEELESKEDKFSHLIEDLQQENSYLTDKIEALESKEDEQFILLDKLKKENGYLSSKVYDLEVENEELAKKVSELEKYERELMEKVKGFENSQIPLKQENSQLVQSCNVNQNAKLELTNKVENFVSIEKEVHESFVSIEKELQECLKSENVESPLDVNVLLNENLTLKKEILLLKEKLKESESSLLIKVQDAEKEQRLLTERLKKQEKKLKKSQRSDNLDDYDALAREVVTYRLEVESLRTENNELHERIMELDESEKTLLEKQEQLQNEVQKSSKLREKLNVLQDAESKFMERIVELEEVEMQLRGQLSNEKNQCNSTDICSASNEFPSKLVDSESELRNKISVLLDGESRLMEKIINLEEVEFKLRQEISSLKLASAEISHIDGTVDNSSVRQPSVDSAYGSVRDAVKCEVCDKMIGTDDFMEGVMGNQEQGKPISSMFVRIQTLESENQKLGAKLSSVTATDNQVKQLTEKVKGLEETEDALMERVMELEEEEDRLKRELKKAQLAARSVSDLEEELTDLHEKERDMVSTIETLDKDKLTLKNSLGISETEKADFAVRLATLQKQYEEEKKKVESLLKGEESWMKSVSSEKKAMEELEKELQSTQEKLEELQTEYESKLSEKESSEKYLKDELNRHVRDKEYMKKKLQEYEISNNELEDEIAACKISESRMFHRHQMLMTQNQELESKLAQLAPDLLTSESNTTDVVDGNGKKAVVNTVMSENPEVISENPLTRSVFTDSELKLLRSEEEENELLGSVPLDMLRKMKEFDQREVNYRSKIGELESKNTKLGRKLKVLINKEKDLKHEIKDLQMELLNYRESTSSLRASTSSLDLDRSSSEDGIDCDSQSFESQDTNNFNVFRLDGKVDTQCNEMTKDQLLLTVKLFEERQLQDSERITHLEGKMNSYGEVLLGVTAMIGEEDLECYLNCVKAFQEQLQQQAENEELNETVMQLLETVSQLRHRYEALQSSEENLRMSEVENEQAKGSMMSVSAKEDVELEDRIQSFSGAEEKYSPTSDSTLNISSISSEVEEKQTVEVGVQSNLGASSVSEKLETRVTSPSPHLETSKIISIDVPPIPHPSLSYLGQSETIRVDVEPTKFTYDTLDGQEYNSTISMMDKAEDVLRQRIKELEKLEKHLKQQVLDLEQDREELHEIARKDKNIIHEQNVLIRELQLTERNLQVQVKSFEASENSLYARLDELENENERLQDKIRHLEILEDRLKSLVKQYKLDEKILVTKSETLETSVQEMTAKEENLKQKVKNLESEKFAFSERSEYLQMRLKELENAEADLAQRTKNQENVVQSLQSTIHELEIFGANAQARIVELESLNMDLTQRLHHSMTENSPLSHHASEMEQCVNSMEHELATLRDSDIRLRQENSALQKTEQSLQQELKVLQMKEIDMNALLRHLTESEAALKDKVTKLLRNENTLKFRVQELENLRIEASDQSLSGRETSFKLPRTLEECQRKIISLQAKNAELQSRTQQNQNISGPDGTVQLPEAEYKEMRIRAVLVEQAQQQMRESDRLNSHLQETIQELRQGKDVCGHDLEIEVLRNRLDHANKAVKTLQNQVLKGRLTQEKEYKITTSREDVSGRQSSLGDMPWVEDQIKPTQGQVAEESIVKTQTGSTQSKPTGNMMSQELLLSDLMSAFKAPGTGRPEDQHWREIESRFPEENSRGSEWINVGKATSLYAADRRHNENRSHRHEEELELGIALPSESESHYYSQNDTDLCRNVAPATTQRPMRQTYVQSPLESHSPPLLHAPHSWMVTDHFGHSSHVPSSVQNFLEDKSDQKEVLSHSAGQLGILSHTTQSLAPSVGDSVADSGQGTASVSVTASGMSLRERIAHIERQLSARESDSAREFKCELDLTSWKAKVQESNRRLEVTEKENKYFKDEINKLEKELEEKTQLFRILKAFLDIVENILKDKNLGSEKEMINKIETEVFKVRADLDDGGHRPADICNDTCALTTELAKKDRELTAKRNEVDSLMQELRQWQQECRTIEDMRSNALDSLRLLEGEVIHLQNADTQLKELKDEYNTLKGQFTKLVDAYKSLEHIRHKLEDVTEQKCDLDSEAKSLKSKVKQLEDKLQVLEGINIEKKELEDQARELSVKLGDHERLQIEHTTLQENLKITTNLLDERMKKVEQLTEEIIDLRCKVQEEYKENYKLKQVIVADRNSDSHARQMTIISHHKHKHDIDMGNKPREVKTGESGQTTLQTTEGMLRAKIVQLKNACNEKDNLIKRLQQEIQRLKSANHLPPRDYNHNQLGRSFSHDSSFDSSDLMAHLSDTELLRDSSPHHTPRPKSADLFSSPQRHVPHRRSYNSVPHTYSGHLSRLRGHNSLLTGTQRPFTGPHNSLGFRPDLNRMPSNPNFVAIADYDPSVFSRSGRQRLELSLKEGDRVLVTGPYDQYGYYEAEANGCVGLVPASYLQPVPNQRSGNRQVVPNYLDASPEKIAHMYNSLQQARHIDTRGLSNVSPVNGHQSGTMDLPGNRRYTSIAQGGPPCIPNNFHVEKIIGNRSLKLSWQPVTLDNQGCNNGVKVTGYKIYKDNKAVIHPRGASVSKAVLENIDIHAHHRFSIQTLSAEGQVSELSEILYEGVEEVTSEENSDTESEMDMHTVIDENEYKHGAKRMFMAVYDYDPAKNSPQDHPNSELQFTAGDVITVYGRQRADGFYHGEINGTRGLVPAFFIEEMPQAPPRTKKAANRNKPSTIEVKEEQTNR